MPKQMILGMRMQQEAGVILVFDRLLERIRPERILEFGTGWGGLTVCLGLWAYMSKVPFHSFDLTPRHDDLEPILRALNVKLLQINIFAAENTIADLIMGKGLTLLLCDDGDKKREVNKFSAYIKHGDVIMLHDYSKDGSVNHEVKFSDIEDSCRIMKLIPMMEEEFRPYNWGAFRRASI